MNTCWELLAWQEISRGALASGSIDYSCIAYMASGPIAGAHHVFRSPAARTIFDNSKQSN